MRWLSRCQILGAWYARSSPLAETASMLLPWSYTDVGFGPGTLSYLASLVGLYALAVRLGQLNGRVGEARATAILDAIANSGDDLAATIAANERAAEQVATSLQSDALVCI